MKIQLVGFTQFHPPFIDGNFWGTDAAGGAALAEFAGRACYESWSKPNPSTATNAGYLKHITDVGHFSVMEHASASFYITGVSRSLTHELVRHRHFSYSQLSQRYVDESKRQVDMIYPPEIQGDDKWKTQAQRVLDEVTNAALNGYDEVMSILDEHRPDLPRKEKRQIARAVLPNRNETRIVVTGNMRSWREFLEKRGAQAADREIRELAVRIFYVLTNYAGMENFFQDFDIEEFSDGTTGVTRG